MKMKASILALAVPVALLAACSRADSPNADTQNDASTMSPAAGTGATGVDTNRVGEPGVNVNSPGVVTDPAVDSEAGASATSPMANPGNATGTGTGTTYGADQPVNSNGMPAGAAGSSRPSGGTGSTSTGTPTEGTGSTSSTGGTGSTATGTPSGTPTPATKGNIQNPPADELGHPKRPAG